MLKTFRENFKRLKWTLWLVIGVMVVFVFVDWGMGRPTGGGEADYAVQIGGHRVSVAEFQREYTEMESRYRQMYGQGFSPELLKAMDLPQQVVNQVVDRQLLLSEATAAGLTVSDEELRSRILRMKDNKGQFLFLQDGGPVGEPVYRRMLSRAGLTPELFEAGTRDQILIEKLNRLLSESAYVSDQELEDDYASRTVKAKISYVLLPAAPLPPGAVTDAEAEAFFAKDKAAYQQSEKRKAKYLLVESDKVKATVKVSDADVAAEYNANPESFKKPEQVHARHILYKLDTSPSAPAGAEAAARAKAEAAAKKLRAGADFAALAKAESDDAGSKANGGDLGTFGRGAMVREFEEAAFNAKPNEIVGPVKSSFGFHVIQVLEKLEARPQPLFEVQSAIRARLADQRAKDEVKRQARELADRIAKLGGKPSDDELRRLTSAAVTFNETEFVGKSDFAAGVGPSPAFNAALFALKPGETSDPVTINRGEAIVKLVEIKKPGLPTFLEVKARVVADLTKKKQDDATVAALAQALAGGVPLAKVAETLKLKVETPDAFPKGGPIPLLGAQRAVLDAAFAANVGDVKGPIAIPDRGAVAFQLLEKTAFDRTAFEAEAKATRERLKSQKSGKLLQAMLARKRAETKIDVNKPLLTRLRGA